MARISEVEYNQVEAACFNLLAEGVNPSFPSVYDRLGRRGSSKIVQDMINRWRKETADRFFARRSHPALPPDIVSAADQMLEQLWGSALAKFDTIFADKVSGAEKRVEEMAEEVRVAQESSNAADEARKATEADLRVAQAEIQALQERLADVEIRLRDANTLLSARDEQIAELRENTGRIASALEAEHLRHQDALVAERQRHEAAVAQIEEKHAAVIERDREIAEGERRYLMQQTDQMRQANNAEIAALKQQNADLKAEMDLHRQRANKAVESAAEARGKAEARAETIAALQGELDSIKPVIDRGRALAAELIHFDFSACSNGVDPSKKFSESFARLITLAEDLK